MKYENKTINVNAYGDGDAFAGNKQIHNDVNVESLIYNIHLAGVSLDQIKSPLDMALNEFRDNKKAQALMRLEMTSELNGLNEDALSAISALRVLLSDERLNSDEERVKAKVVGSELTGFAKDLVEAAFLKVLHLEVGEERAVGWYHSLTNTGEHVTYVYLQRFASKDDVITLYEEKEALSVAILHVMFDRALDYSLIEIAGGLLERLRVVKPLTNYDRYQIILDCVNTRLFETKDYFQLTSADKTEFDRLRDSLIRLLKEGDEIDFRMLHILVQLYQFTQHSCPHILSILEQFKDPLGEKNYYDNGYLKSILTMSDKQQYVRLKELEPEEISMELIGQVEDDFCNFAACKFLFDSGDEDLIVGTLKRLSESDTMGAKVNFVALAATSSTLLKPQDFPYIEINDLIDGQFRESPLSSTFVDRIGLELATYGQPELAVSFYDIIFEGVYPWLSGPYLSFLKLLFQTRQYKAISTRIELLTEDERQTSEILTLCSLLASKDNNHELAASLIKMTIDGYEPINELDSFELKALVYLWGQYLSYVKLDDPEKVKELTNEVPKAVLDTYHELYSWRLVSFFIHRLEDVAERMLDWFFEDPYSHAKDFFSVYFQACQYHNEPVLPAMTGKYKHAYLYRENHNSHIKVTVPRNYKHSNPQFLIEQGGVTATKLEGALEGTPILLSMKLCTLESKLHPLQAVNMISQRIMDEDEQEVFYEIKIPENASGDEILAEIEKYVAPVYEHLDQLKPIMENATIPVDMKFGELHGSDFVIKAFIAILDSGVRFMATTDNEPAQADDCKDFVLTEITAIYLACLGEELFPDCNWHMTEPVFNELHAYAENCQGKKPYYNSDHRTVYFGDSDKVEEVPTDVLKNLKSILGRTTVHSDRDLDIPLDLRRRFRNLLKDNFLLSLALAEHLGKGLFCVDVNTRIFLRTFGYESLPLCPAQYANTLISNESDDIFGNIIWVNRLNCQSNLSYERIAELLRKANNEHLQQLSNLLIERPDMKWGSEWLLILITTCLEAIVKRRLDLMDTDNLELALVEMLSVFMKAEKSIDANISSLIECAPIPRLFEYYENDPRGLKTMKNVFIEVTDCYMQAMENAVSRNHYPLSSFWKSFAEACI